MQEKLLNSEAAGAIAAKFTEEEQSRMLPLIGVTEQFDAEAPAEHESSGQALSRWEEWRDAAGQRELARTVEVMSLWMHDRNKAAERDLALIFLFFEVLVAISALVLFFIQPFPSGSL